MDKKFDWFGFYTVPAFYIDGIPMVFKNDPNEDPWEVKKRLAKPLISESWGSYKLTVATDGLIAFHNKSLVQNKGDYFLAANAFHILLLLEESEGIALFSEPVHLGLYDLIEFPENQEYHQLSPHSKTASPLKDRDNAFFDLEPYALGFRKIVRKEVITSAIEKFKSCSKDIESLRYLSQLMKAFSEYGGGSYELGIVVSWFIVEKLINQRWDNYCKSKSYSRGQLQNLNGREYTASVKGNVLQLAGILNPELFAEIEKVRAFRNRIVHKDHVYGKEECYTAIHLAMKMLEERLGFQLKPLSNK